MTYEEAETEAKRLAVANGDAYVIWRSQSDVHRDYCVANESNPPLFADRFARAVAIAEAKTGTIRS